MDEHGLPRGEGNIDRTCKRLDMAPPRVLRLLLGAIEPVALGKFALKAFQTKGCREAAKGPMLKLAEYVLEKDRTSAAPFGGDLRMIVQSWKARNEQLGRRARDLALPVNWAESGFYSVFENDGKWWVKDKLSGETAVIKDCTGREELVGGNPVEFQQDDGELVLHGRF